MGEETCSRNRLNYPLQMNEGKIRRGRTEKRVYSQLLIENTTGINSNIIVIS